MLSRLERFGPVRNQPCLRLGTLAICCKVEIVVAPETQIQKAIERYYKKGQGADMSAIVTERSAST